MKFHPYFLHLLPILCEIWCMGSKRIAAKHLCFVKTGQKGTNFPYDHK